MSLAGRHERIRYRRMDFTFPPDLLWRMRLVRALTGIPVKEWVRAQIALAVDIELTRRPGMLWARPGSRVYRLDWTQGADPIPVPIATTEGGERVYIIEILADYPIAHEDDSLDRDKRRTAIICDLIPEDGRPGLSMRRVALAAHDVLPRANAIRTGLGAIRERRERETRRRNAAYRRARRAMQRRAEES